MHPLAATADPAAIDRQNDAAIFLDPAFQALPTIAKYSSLDSAEGGLSHVLAELKTITSLVTGGDMKYPEGLAVTQATALNIMFSRLSTLALTNFGHKCFDSLMRLAFRAQAQSARTLETLATLKSPAVFAHQLNVAHQQVVANGPLPAPSGEFVVPPLGGPSHPSDPVLAPSSPRSMLPHGPANIVRLAQKHFSATAGPTDSTSPLSSAAALPPDSEPNIVRLAQSEIPPKPWNPLTSAV
jgi:hypothetical protein